MQAKIGVAWLQPATFFSAFAIHEPHALSSINLNKYHTLDLKKIWPNRRILNKSHRSRQRHHGRFQ